MLGVLFFERVIQATRVYFKNIAILLAFIVFFVALRYFTGSIDWFLTGVKNGVTLGNYVFATIQGIVLYYAIVGLLEESSKHCAFLGSSLADVDTLKKGALLSVFIALGFGFIENILYLTSIVASKGIGGDFITTTLFRSVFSVFVHIFCGMIVAVAFSRAFLTVKGKFFQYAHRLFIGFLLSIIVHAIYDVTLTFGYTMVVFLYFAIGYLYTTKIFHQDVTF